jgi:hypothetical protein
MIPMTYAEALSQEEEDAAFANGATMVVRLDLLPGYSAPVVPPPEEPPFVPPTGGESIFITFDSVPFIDNAGHAITTIGSPVSVDGMGDFSSGARLLIADSADIRFGSNDFELSFDFKLKSVLPSNNHSFMVSKGASGDLNNAWYLGIFSGSYLAFVPANNSDAIYVSYPHISDFTNAHNIKLSRVSGVVSLYVDDILLGVCTPGTGGVPNIYEGNGSLYIAGWNYSTASTRGDCFDNFRLVINPS